MADFFFEFWTTLFGAQEQATWSESDSDGDSDSSLKAYEVAPQRLKELHIPIRTRRAKLGSLNKDQKTFTEIIEDDDNEPEEDYRKGGYHPMQNGEDLQQHRYKIIRKLGWGVYSTVWLAKENLTELLVAIKVQKSALEYGRAAQNEIALLRDITARVDSDGGLSKQRIVEFHESFNLIGPNGSHTCMVFEFLGHSLLGLLQTQERCSLSTATYITCQILDGLNFLHSQCRVMHTDIKPENILFVPGSSRAWPAVKIVDLGNACVVENQVAQQIQTREYRSLEAIIGSWPYTTAVDVWSVAAMLHELITGDILFETANHSEGKKKDERHIAQIVQYTGPIKPAVLRSGRWSKSLTASPLLKRAEMSFEIQSLSNRMASFIEMEDGRKFAKVIRRGLNHVPQSRPTAKEMRKMLLDICPSCPRGHPRT